MSIVSGIVVYVLVWWVVIFCVLPLNIKSMETSKDGSMPGAPVNPDLKRKLLVTTLLSCLVWLIIFGIIRSDLISFHDMAAKMAM